MAHRKMPCNHFANVAGLLMLFVLEVLFRCMYIHTLSFVNKLKWIVQHEASDLCVVESDKAGWKESDELQLLPCIHTLVGVIMRIQYVSSRLHSNAVGC